MPLIEGIYRGIALTHAEPGEPVDVLFRTDRLQDGLSIAKADVDVYGVGFTYHAPGLPPFRLNPEWITVHKPAKAVLDA